MTELPGNSENNTVADLPLLPPRGAAFPAYRFAKVGAWYLLIGAALRLIVEVAFRDSEANQGVAVLHTLTYGTSPQLPIPLPYEVNWWLPGIVHVVILGLGLIFVATRVKTGIIIVYALHVVLGVFAAWKVLFGRFDPWSDGDWTYLGFWLHREGGSVNAKFYQYLSIELLGIALALAALIAVFVGLRHAGPKPRKASAADLEAARAQYDQEWRVAEVKKWQEAYSLANNGAAPPPGFMPPITTQPPYAPYAPHAGTNVMAILALVFGIGGGLLGVIFGHVALSQIKRTGENGRGLALAGLILGYIGLALLIAWVIFVLVLANSDPYSY